jgi:acetyl-CoA carboxylase carboxyl transferase subunit beta
VEEPLEEVPETPYDEGTFETSDSELVSHDPLGWPGYMGDEGYRNESVSAGPARIDGREVELALFDFSVMGGSMGEVAGERLARALERAAARRVPFVLRTSTGGARMQEGMRALVQMPKVVAARIELARAHSPFIAVLGHPTTGGVLASLAALADVTVAEAGATIGFAGPRVAEAFTGKPLGGLSHKAETALGSGLVDDVIEPSEMRRYLQRAVATLAADVPEAADPPREDDPPSEPEDPWASVERARSAGRPLGFELLLEMADSLIELRGDREGEDDPAVDCAITRVRGRRIVAIALDRERVPGPGAYRKARRCIEIAGRLDLPIVTLVDTRGADPGEHSESHGIAWEIARTFEAMLSAPVPTLSIVTGEGGSGGALAFAATDALLIYRDAVFSVIGPEMTAEILWRDPTRAPEAAALLKPTAAGLLELGIADGILPEPPTAASTGAAIAYHLGRSTTDGAKPEQRVAERLKRWRDRDAYR